MPELKRNFMQGKMNKDLDERLIHNGEYRDALNIEVSTSEGSNVGSVENISGNISLDNIRYEEPFYDGNQQLFDRFGQPIGFGNSYPGEPILQYSASAEVVGAIADERTKKIYTFIGGVLDYSATTSIASSETYMGGIKSDAILEFDNTNDRKDYVFTDVHQVQRQWGVFQAGKRNAKTNITTNEAPAADAPIDGTTRIQLYQDDYWNYLNGLEVGMKVELVDPSDAYSLNQWEAEGKVTILDFSPVFHEANPYIYIVLDKEVSNTNNEYYLRFTKEDRLLSFSTSTKHSSTKEYLSGGEISTFTESTPTPSSSKITAINVFDGLLYWTDGVSEPKKINIDRSKRGTSSLGFYKTTRLYYKNHLNEWKVGKMSLEDVTVIKKSPLNPPALKLLNTTRSGEIVSRIGISPIDLYEKNLGDAVSLQIVENAQGDLLKPLTILSEEHRGWSVDDRILLQSNTIMGSSHGGFEVILKITGYNYGAGTLTTEFVSSNAAYEKFGSETQTAELGGGPAPLSWEASLIEDEEAIFQEKFVRVATRWRYADGEVSAISPFTLPAFIPKGLYSFSDKEAFNTAMVNDLRKMIVHRFIPKDIPKEVEEVDLLYKEDGNNNIYLLKTVKKKDKYIIQSGPDAGTHYPWIANGPINVGGFYSDDKGNFEVTGSTYGSVIPSNQILRPFDAVPRTAKAQEVSGSRLIYANYTQNYDVLDSDGNNIDLNFTKWDNEKGVYSVDYDKTNYSDTFGVGAIKAGRDYTMGVVYKDRFGRESSVLIGENSTISVPYNRSTPQRIGVNLNNNAPYWAEYFKFFVKQDSNEYYNISLYRAFQSQVSDGKTTECWLAFNSPDRNKVSEGDYLVPKMSHRFSSPTSTNEEFKVIDISNEYPRELKDTPGFDPSVDIDGKFFVKVKNSRVMTKAVGINPGDDAQWYGWGGPGRSWSSSAVFEVKPDPKVDLDVFYEVPKTYPIKLTKQNVNNWASVGDKVFVYYKSVSNSAIVGDTYGGGLSDPGYRDILTSIKKIEGPSIKGGLTKIVLDQSITFPALYGVPAASTLLSPGTVHIVCQDGSKVVGTLSAPPGYDQYDDIVGATDTIYIKSDSIHNSNIYIPFWNSINFKQGVESNRIKDDFNATTIQNGVKVSTTSENYKFEERKTGMIFSGIYNSKNGVNNLNQFISAEGIRKDLNPQFGSIQKLNARDTDITVCCQDKIVKVLSNKDALFNADSSGGSVTSTNKVLGQVIPYQGDYGIGNNPESFVVEEFRSYFVDAARGAVLRLSKDGLTNIAQQGMGDWFSDRLKTAKAVVGAYNRDKGEYDLAIHYNVDDSALTKKLATLSYKENIKGWSSFKSYNIEAGLSVNNDYYTFKNGQTYKHSEDATVNNFYGVQYFSSVTPVINDMPGSIKSFTSVNYEGSQGKVNRFLNDGAGDHTEPYYNNLAKAGWYVSSATTNEQTGRVHEFIEKEGKWFNYIHGEELNFDNSNYSSANLDSQEFSVQGLGSASSVQGGDTGTYTLSVDTLNLGTEWVGSSTSVIAGTNVNGTVLTLTLTVPSCKSYDSSGFSFDDDLPSWIASFSKGWVGNPVFYPGDTATVNLNLASVIPTTDLVFLPEDINVGTISNICSDHQVDVDFLGDSGNNYTYEISSPVGYAVYLEDGETKEFEVIGTHVNDGTAMSIFSVTFTAEEGYTIPLTTSFDPQEYLEDDAEWDDGAKQYVYDDLGNIKSVVYTYSFNGSDPHESPFDRFLFPDPDMTSSFVEPEFNPASQPVEFFTHNVLPFWYNGSNPVALSQDHVGAVSAPYSIEQGAPLSSVLGHSVVFYPLPGFTLIPAANWNFIPSIGAPTNQFGSSEEIQGCTFTDGPDGTVIGLVTFVSTEYAQGDDEGWTLAVAGDTGGSPDYQGHLVTSASGAPETVPYTSFISLSFDEEAGITFSDLAVSVTSGLAVIHDATGFYMLRGDASIYDTSISAASNQITLATVVMTLNDTLPVGSNAWKTAYDHALSITYGNDDLLDIQQDGDYVFDTPVISTTTNTNDTITYVIKWTPPNADLTAQFNTFDFNLDNGVTIETLKDSLE